MTTDGSEQPLFMNIRRNTIGWSQNVVTPSGLFPEGWFAAMARNELIWPFYAPPAHIVSGAISKSS